MYLDTDDARSDFILAAAVYLVGGLLIGFLLQLVVRVLPGSLVLATVVSVLVPFLLLWAMPLFLMRYRGEDLRSLVAGGQRSLVVGLALGAAVAAGTLLGDLVAGGGPLDGLTGVWADPVNLASRVVEWTGVAILVTFLHRRAEHAFRTIDDDAEQLHLRAAIGTAGAAAIASVLLLLAGTSIGLLFSPLGFVAAYFVATRLIPSRGVAERWQVLSPLIVLALGRLRLFGVFGDSAGFLIDLRGAGMLAAFGLLAVMALRAGLGGRTPLVLGVVIAALSSVSVFGASL